MSTTHKLIGIVVCVLGALSGCREQILHNLSESEANKVVNRLHEKRIQAEKTRQSDGRWMISVERTESMPALAQLERERLLKEEEKRGAESSSLISSRETQRFSFERSLSGEIEKTLEGIEGVLEARVHLNLPQTDPLFGTRVQGEKGSASVLLLTDRLYNQEKAAIAGIVAGASGVAASEVSVLVTMHTATADAAPQAARPLSSEPFRELPLEWMYAGGSALIAAGLLGLIVIKRTRGSHAQKTQPA